MLPRYGDLDYVVLDCSVLKFYLVLLKILDWFEL